MSLLDAFVLEPFSVNEPLIDSLLLEPDAIEVFIADSPEKGSGTAWDPYGAQTAAVFDALMNSFPPNTTVHLGPGTFLTHGHADGVAGGWQPRRRFRIVGAGVDITMLKLDFATLAPEVHAHYFVIGGDDNRLLDECEFADFKIDCNLRNNATTVQVAAGGIKAFGSHIRIRRLRVIDFGTQTNLQRGVAISTAGAFPENPDPFDCVVEDCVVDEPYANSVRETACIELAGGEDDDGLMGNHKGCVVRNCLINCMYVDQPEVQVADITLSSPDATVIPKNTVNAERGVNDWIVVTGAVIDNSIANSYNGTYKITAVIGGTSHFKYQPDGYGGLPDPTVDPAGEIYIGRAPCHRVAIDSIAEVVTNSKWEITTKTPHNRLPTQNVRLNNIQGGAVFNVDFSIVDGTTTITPIKLRFDLNTSDTPSLNNSYVGVDFYGIVVNGGRSIILENNRILNTTFGVYHGEWSTKDAIIRDNYFYNVLSAVYFKLGQVSGGDSNQQPQRNTNGVPTRSGSTVTVHTSNPHGLRAGDSVVITGATPTDYNGAFSIHSVPDPTSFTYLISTTPGAASGTTKFGVSGRWDV